MKNKKADCCPGCGRHCRPGCEKCKYGKRYFEKQTACRCSCGCAQAEKKQAKWKKRLEKDGLLRRMLAVSRGIKRALKGETRSEAEIMGALSEAERAQLAAILEKLEDCLKADSPSKG